MPDLGLAAVFGREIFGRRRQHRQSPPSDLLGEQLILEAMSSAGGVDGRYAAGYLYHAARLCQALTGSERCIDLGAGPGCQLLQVAALNPEIHFVGVDRSKLMLKHGAAVAEQLGVANVEWVEDDVTTLGEFGNASVDAIISTMTLHDLPDIEALHACLAAVRRVLSPGSAIYIEDYARLKSPRSIEYFNSLNGGEAARDAFHRLNECSLSAAFTFSELRSAVREHLPSARLYSTFLVPFLTVTKTPDRPLDPKLKTKLLEMREALPSNKRRDLDDIRRFFSLGGLSNDPFA